MKIVMIALGVAGFSFLMAWMWVYGLLAERALW